MNKIEKMRTLMKKIEEAKTLLNDVYWEIIDDKFQFTLAKYCEDLLNNCVNMATKIFCHEIEKGQNNVKNKI